MGEQLLNELAEINSDMSTHRPQEDDENSSLVPALTLHLIFAWSSISQYQKPAFLLK